MAFQRTRTINGRSYTYWEERYREGGKVKSRHLGKLRFLPQPIPPEEVGLRYIERQMEKYPGDPFATKAVDDKQRTEKAAALFKEGTGLDLPTRASDAPVDKSAQGSQAEGVSKDSGNDGEKGEGGEEND